jgi:hypothetical protein
VRAPRKSHPADELFCRILGWGRRLTEEERTLLRVLESALNVSEYTDNVDTMRARSKTMRIKEELLKLFAYCLGLMLCSDIHAGRALVEQNLEDMGPFFSRLFEVGRRYKIMNPEKMRGTYGKLMYMLQVRQYMAMKLKEGIQHGR